jgi:hypothetical protein
MMIEAHNRNENPYKSTRRRKEVVKNLKRIEKRILVTEGPPPLHMHLVILCDSVDLAEEENLRVDAQEFVKPVRSRN